MGGLSWWHWLIILAVFILLFGAKKLPDAARGVGRSLRILKSEVSAMHEDDEKAKQNQTPGETDASAAVATPTAQIMGTPAAPAAPQYPTAQPAAQYPTAQPAAQYPPAQYPPAQYPPAPPVVNGVPVAGSTPVDEHRT